MIRSFKEYPEYIYTGFSTRLLAFIIDIIMIGSLQRITLFNIGEGIVKTLLSLMIYLLYFILMTKLNNGQTIGKMILGIKVIGLGEEELTWQTVIIREGFGRYVQKSIMVLYLIAIFTPYKQHFVDLLVDTSVVTIKYLNLFQKEQTNQNESISEEFIVE